MIWVIPMDIAILLDGGSSYRRSILDRVYGRRDVWIKKSGLSPGSCIRYTLTANRGNVWMSDYTIEAMPFIVARADMLFLHHVLELCYYFIPVGMADIYIFELLYQLYILPYEYYSVHFKKLFVCKLLGMIGVYPQISKEVDTYIAQFQTCSIDALHTYVLDEEGKKKINQWLWTSVMSHPASHTFRTVHFLLT